MTFKPYMVSPATNCSAFVRRNHRLHKKLGRQGVTLPALIEVASTAKPLPLQNRYTLFSSSAIQICQPGTSRLSQATWSPDAPDRADEGLPVAGTHRNQSSRALLSPLQPAPRDWASPRRVKAWLARRAGHGGRLRKFTETDFGPGRKTKGLSIRLTQSSVAPRKGLGQAQESKGIL